MPFTKRYIRSVKLKKTQSKRGKSMFQDFDDVTNFTLAGAIVQLASLCHHAEDIFGELNEEIVVVHRRCKNVSDRIKRLQNKTEQLDAKNVKIPVSDLDAENGIPPYLHYQSPNSLEEDLFTRDTRMPCLIHLHQKARQDLNYILRGSEAYSKNGRPRSLDPRLLMDELGPGDLPYSPISSRNSTFLSSSTHINSNSIDENGKPLPTSEQKMKIVSSDAKYDVITVDTSGENFERQANLRRSQRISSCSVRQRNNAAHRRQLRSRHKTLTGVPGNISNEFSDIRPYSLHSDANNSIGLGTGSSFVDSEESPSVVNGHVVVSPRQNQRNAEIQTEDVKVLPLTPIQRRMKLKSSPASSHASTEYLESPTAVPCPTVPDKNHTSTPINGVHAKQMIRPTSLDVANNDTSTDEGRHTGESNPPTPVRSRTPKGMSTSPHAKSPSSPMTSKGSTRQQNGKPEKDIALRNTSARLQQGEDRASSGVWSGTESTRHSSTSDIATQQALIANALNKELKRRSPGSPIAPKSAGQISPFADNKPWLTPSTVSSSTVSINSKLSTIDHNRSASSLRDDDDRFQSPASSVISVTLTRSVTGNSNMSLCSVTSEGTALSAADVMRKSRKSKNTGAYNFMNYEVDPLENESASISRVVKSRSSARRSKHRGGSKKRLNGEDTISMTSMADSSLLTDTDARSAHSGHTPNDTTSLSGSIFSVDQEGYFTSMHEDSGLSKKASPSTPSAPSMATTPETAVPELPTPVTVAVIAPSPKKKEQAFFGERFQQHQASESGDKSNYNSYNRAVKSNHSTPKSLAQKPKSQSVKVQKSPGSPALDFQAELNKRLSLRRVAPSSGSSKSSFKKDKRGAPPPPPKRNSSLSSSASASPALSHKSLSEGASPLSPLSTHSSISKSPVFKPNVTSPPPPPVPEAAEVAYMETLPPPPTPDQLEEIARESVPSTPQMTRAKSPKTPPAKPHRSSFLGGKHAPGTAPKPNVHVVTLAAPTSPKSPTQDATSPEPAKIKPYFSTSADAPKEIAKASTEVTTITETTIVKSDVIKTDVIKTEVSKPVVKSPPAVAPKASSVKPDIASKPMSPKKNDVIDGADRSVRPAVAVKPVTSPKVETKKESPSKGAPAVSTKPMTSPKKDGVTSASVQSKTAPPLSAKPVTSPKKDGVTNTSVESKGAPPVSAKPVTSPKKHDIVKAPSPSKIAPPVSAKPVTSPKNDDERVTFSEKKTREQSPSHRAKLARAAFFGHVQAPHGKTEENTDNSSSQEDKPAVEAKNEESGSKTSEVTPDPTAENQKATPDSSHEPAQAQKEEKAPEKDQKDAPLKENIAEEAITPDNTDWLEKIDEFSSPATATKPTTDAAYRLRLSGTNKESPKQTPKFSTYENLMAAIHKSKRETLSGKPAGESPPSSPGTSNEVFSYRSATAALSNGNKSPGSTLERKRNGRLSSNGHRNGISRKSTGATSRDDFKALLLQNACRGTNGSQMTAAEKLLLNRPPATSAAAALSRQRPHSFADTSSLQNTKDAEEAADGEQEEPVEPARPMLSLNDIRSAITSGSATTRQGRTNRRAVRSTAMDVTAKKSATLSLHGKKHPPPSMSSKYNTRSRTPTRPMMSISEDSETEKSPEQGKSQTRIVER